MFHFRFDLISYLRSISFKVTEKVWTEQKILIDIVDLSLLVICFKTSSIRIYEKIKDTVLNDEFIVFNLWFMNLK